MPHLHPLLDTLDQNNLVSPAIIHIPFFVLIQLHNIAIKIIHWNVMHNSKQNLASSEGIASFLTTMTQTQKPDFIILYYVPSAPNNLYILLQQQFTNRALKYRCVAIQKQNNHCTLIFYLNQFEEYPEKYLPDSERELISSYVFFKIKSNPKQILLLAHVNQIPQQANLSEERIFQFLNHLELNFAKILIGNFAGHVAPNPNHAPQNNISLMVTNTEGTRYYAAAGCFYSYLQNNIKHTRQSEICHLNPSSGEIYRMEPLNLNDVSEQELLELLQLRSLICIDQFYQETPLIPDGTNLFQCERELRTQLNTPRIWVRAASSLNGTQALSITVPTCFISTLILLENPHLHFYPEKPRTVFVAKKFFPDLKRVLTQLAHNPDFLQFAKVIAAFSAKKNAQALLKTLFSTMQQELTEQPHPYSHLVRKFLPLLHSPHLPSQQTWTQMHNLFHKSFTIKKADTCQRALFKNVLLSAIFYGLIGAIIGAVIGALLSLYAGGVGALPGLIIGFTAAFGASGCMLGTFRAVTKIHATHTQRFFVSPKVQVAADAFLQQIASPSC